MNILGKYQNQYMTKCQAQLRGTEIQKSVTKLFIYMLHHVHICMCVCVCVYTHTQSDTKFSTQWENGLFIYKTYSLWAPLQ